MYTFRAPSIGALARAHRKRLDRSDNPREAVAPIAAMAGYDPDALAVAMREHAVTVMLDLVQPIGAYGRGRCSGREAGLEWEHGGRMYRPDRGAARRAWPKARPERRLGPVEAIGRPAARAVRRRRYIDLQMRPTVWPLWRNMGVDVVVPKKLCLNAL